MCLSLLQALAFLYVMIDINLKGMPRLPEKGDREINRVNGNLYLQGEASEPIQEAGFEKHRAKPSITWRLAQGVSEQIGKMLKNKS